MIHCGMYIEGRKKKRKSGHMTTSGLKFYIKAENPGSHHLTVGIKVDSPFTGTNLLLSFPRWVPGSYFLREPIQHVFDISVQDEQGTTLKHERNGVDSLKIFNIKTGEIFRLEASMDDLNTVITTLLNGRFQEPIKKNDDEFIDDCKKYV